MYEYTYVSSWDDNKVKQDRIMGALPSLTWLLPCLARQTLCERALPHIYYNNIKLFLNLKLN